MFRLFLIFALFVAIFNLASFKIALIVLLSFVSIPLMIGLTLALS